MGVEYMSETEYLKNAFVPCFNVMFGLNYDVELDFFFFFFSV